MANRFWVGGTATWDTTAGTKWAATSGGAGGSSVPTAADDVFFDANSGTGTITTSATALQAVCRSLNFTGFTGTFTNSNASPGLAIGDASGGALTLSSGMTYNNAGSLSAIRFNATTDNGGAGWPITTAGKTMGGLTFFTAGGKWTLQDNLTATGGSATITLAAGHFDTNSKTVTSGLFSSSNSTTRSLTLGTSSLTMTSANTAWTVQTATGFTMSGASSTINLTGSSAIFNHGSSAAGSGVVYGTLNITGAGGSLITIAAPTTVTNLSRTGTAVKTDSLTLGGDVTVTGTFTANGNSTNNRLLVASFTVGTSRTITAAAVSTSNSDWRDITGAGAASWNLSAITGNSGDNTGNSGITFTPSTTQTWQGTSGGNWSDVTKWTSRVPLSQDDVVIASAFSATQTVTTDMPRLGRNIDWTGATGTTLRMASAVNTTSNMTGSLTLASGMGVTVASGSLWVFIGRGSHTITTNGVAIGVAMQINSTTGSYSLGSDFTSTTNTFLVASGTFNTANYTASWAATVTVSSGATVNFGSSSLTFGGQLVGGAGTTFLFGTSVSTFTTTATQTFVSLTSTATVDADEATFVLSNASANTRTFAGGGKTYGILRYNVAASAGGLTITGSNTFSGLEVDTTVARTLTLPSGIGSTAVGKDGLLLSGRSGALLSVVSSTAGTKAGLATYWTDAYGNVWVNKGNALVQQDTYVDLPGVNGNYVMTDDKSALDITGDIEMIYDAAPDSLTATTQSLIGKLDTGTQRSYLIQSNITSGTVSFIGSPDGTSAAQFSAASSAGIGSAGYSNGQRVAVKATRRSSDGRVQFFTAPTATDTFTQLGTDQVAGAGLNLYASNIPLEIGNRAAGTQNPYAGNMYRAIVKNGIGGTTVADWSGARQSGYAQINYASLQDIQYIGSHNLYATNSTNVSNNSGMTFGEPPTGVAGSLAMMGIGI